MLAPIARSGSVRAAICLDPPHALEFAFGHLCLSYVGLRDDGFDRLLALSTASEASNAGERAPNRELERGWLASLAGSPVSGRALSGVLRQSSLARPIDALAPSREHMYALTHALMFVTNLGGRPVRLPRSRSQLGADVEALLAWCVDGHDYDLAAELLLTWPFLGLRWTATAAFAFEVLARVEDGAGFLPSPATDLARYQMLAGANRSRYAVASAYHTAYAMGLLVAAILRAGRAPPAPIPAPRTRQLTLSRDLVSLLGTEQSPRHWREMFDELGAARQEALAPLLLDVCLQRAVAKRDLGALQRALRRVASTSLATRAAPRQGVELLRRAAALDQHAAEPDADLRATAWTIGNSPGIGDIAAPR